MYNNKDVLISEHSVRTKGPSSSHATMAAWPDVTLRGRTQASTAFVPPPGGFKLLEGCRALSEACQPFRLLFLRSPSHCLIAGQGTTGGVLLFSYDVEELKRM